MATETITITVGTAGHIDHGKTSLVKMLTGCDTDTMPEEKARGMTIDLGFASCVLPDGRRVGIVDVPGHERFIHNMVAGASGIDVVLLVVAADDGVMQQTLEHFHIVRLLGVTAGMVALTKIDMVSPERVAEVSQVIRALVHGSFLEGCAITPVSAKTGDGYSEFYDQFVAMVNRTASRNASGAFRLHIESSFVIQGIGTVVSGIPRSGRVAVGESLELMPGGGEKRVRGLQVFGVDAETGCAGECVGLRMNDVTPADVKRGMVLATPGYFEATKIVNAKFHAMPGMEKPIKPRCAVRFHSGTTDVTGYLVLPENKPLFSGGESYVQLQLNEPVVVAMGDFFVVRLLSPVRTLGGGHVVSADTTKLRRTRGNWTERCEQREQAFETPVAAVDYVLSQAGDEPLVLEEVARRSQLTLEATRQALGESIAAGRSAELPGNRYASSSLLKSVRDHIVRTLGGMHTAKPLGLGFERKDVLHGMAWNRLLVDRALADMETSGELVANEYGLSLKGRTPQLTPKQNDLAVRISAVYAKAGVNGLGREELALQLGVPLPLIAPVFNFLVQRRELAELNEKVILHRDVVEKMKTALLQHLDAHGTIDVGTFKDLIGASRKFAIPMLEYFDMMGVTRRVGDLRRRSG